MRARRQKPETAVGDLFGGRPEDLALVREMIRELNWQVRHWQAEWPRWIDRRFGSPPLTLEVAERRLAVLAKAMTHCQALEAYLLDRTGLVHAVAHVLSESSGLYDGGGGLVLADDVLRLVEARLKLGDARLQVTPPAGAPARGASA